MVNLDNTNKFFSKLPAQILAYFNTRPSTTLTSMPFLLWELFRGGFRQKIHKTIFVENQPKRVPELPATFPQPLF